ncbi:DUF2272 domain-containing protein [Variovorax ginsengisoli]|uniref:DUF2272 domain-containing protein n=1 Tax=Variovorax ginsengisoli TaxID=363844 RepID=A0ABT9SDA4_9BURK|nr:DUF2272 domain-containing protein [Variovorax ginsengisoli]MDP9902333.1 hypothetical protein [Variovorax ginsengisoli]
MRPLLLSLSRLHLSHPARPLLPSPALACGLLAAVVVGAHASPACLATAQRAPPPRALAMAAAAVTQQQAFGNQTLDAEGRLLQSGDAEGEDTRRTLGAIAPWQRVLQYWDAVDRKDEHLPSLVRFGAWRPADRSLLQQALNQATSARLQGLGVGSDEGLSSDELRAMSTALDRVAVIDTPWSAAFISWVARQAGLEAGEFAFSPAHADYAAAAWQTTLAESTDAPPTAYAMRACDLPQTTPRVGDLACQARASDAGLDSFDKLGEALMRRRSDGGALRMHCDVVVAVDATGFDTIGGNVLQSVTRRRLVFAPGTLRLDPSYLPQVCAEGATGCVDRHMSRQPWALLLQWR